MPTYNASLLEAALIGYQKRRAEIDAAITALEGRLGMRGKGDVPGPFVAAPRRKRRKLSAAARKRIAEAQRKRWAAYRKQRG